MLRALTFMAAVSLLLGGCTTNRSSESTTKSVRLSDLVAVHGPAPAGRLYVKAGSDDLNEHLFGFQFSSPRQARVTTNARITTLDGCTEKLVVSAQQEVGWTDHIQELQDGKLVSIENLGIQAGSDPHVSPDCRILHFRLAEANAEVVSEVMSFDPAPGLSKSVAKGAPWSAPHGGPTVKSFSSTERQAVPFSRS